MKTYSYSTDEEHFIGHYESYENAAENAFNDIADIDTVFVGENKKHTAHDFIIASRILEDISDVASDEGPECAQDWLHDGLVRNKEKCAELQKLIGDWIELNEPVDFFTVDNIVTFNRIEFKND